MFFILLFCTNVMYVTATVKRNKEKSTEILKDVHYTMETYQGLSVDKESSWPLIFHVCICMILVNRRLSMLKNMFRFVAVYTTCLTNDKNIISNFGSINVKRLKDKIIIQIKKIDRAIRFCNLQQSFLSCKFKVSNHIGKDHQHIVTGELQIITYKRLRKLIIKSPEYREKK